MLKIGGTVSTALNTTPWVIQIHDSVWILCNMLHSDYTHTRLARFRYATTIVHNDNYIAELNKKWACSCETLQVPTNSDQIYTVLIWRIVHKSGGYHKYCANCKEFTAYFISTLIIYVKLCFTLSQTWLINRTYFMNTCMCVYHVLGWY